MGKRIISQRRGHGSSVYRSPSHKHLAPSMYPRDGVLGTVEDLMHSPGKSSPYAKIRMENGKVTYIVAAEGMHVGQEIHFDGSKLDVGNIAKLMDIPEGTLIFNIEAKPGDGGKYVKAGGAYSVMVSRGIKAVVQMPSGEFKSFPPECRATIGKCAGGGRRDKPILKAGTKYHYTRTKAKNWPVVRGVAMNAINHPHGGGNHQHVGVPNSVSRHAPPGRKVGNMAPKKRVRKKKRSM